MHKKVMRCILSATVVLILLSCKQTTEPLKGGKKRVKRATDTTDISTLYSKQEIHTVLHSYAMVTVPGRTVTGNDNTENKSYWHQCFQKGITVTLDDFFIGETEVSYELWYIVRKLAEQKGYVFANPGRAGTIAKHDKNKEGKYVAESRVGELPQKETKKHPVTQLCWYDAIVWCNAYSELMGKKPVYIYKGKPVKDAEELIEYEQKPGKKEFINPCLLAEVKRENGGFRLPTASEWEYAARGGDPNAQTWNNLYAGTNDNKKLSEYANYNREQDTYESKGSTIPVKSLKPNALKLYDMSGNVAEYCYDVCLARQRPNGKTMAPIKRQNPDHPLSNIPQEDSNGHFIPGTWDEFPRTTTDRNIRGGSWDSDDSYNRISRIGMAKANSANPWSGFRLVQSNK